MIIIIVPNENRCLSVIKERIDEMTQVNYRNVATKRERKQNPRKQAIVQPKRKQTICEIAHH